MATKPYIFQPNSVYSFTNPRRQYFSISFCLIRFITEKPSLSKGYEKLQKTCKYFYSNNKKIIVLNENIFWTDNQFNAWVCEVHLKTHKLYLGNHQYWLTQSLSGHSNTNFECFQKHIYRCDLYKLMIENQNITLNEINFMLNGGKITYLSLWKVNIRDSQNVPVPIDLILSKTPKAATIWYRNKSEKFSTKTFENLNDLKFYQKFNIFFLHISKTIEKDIDPSILAEFIRKNCNSSSSFCFDFSSTFYQTYQDSLKFAAKTAGNLKNCHVDVKFGVL